MITATFGTGIVDEGYGLISMLEVPGADAIQIYQPRHAVADDL